MTEIAHWHGTQPELQRLRIAVQHHCACTAHGQPICASHAMLQDVRVLDHLLYVYRTAGHFERAEWSTEFCAAAVATPNGCWTR